MWSICLFFTVIGCIYSTDRSHVVYTYTDSDNVDRGPFALEDEAIPARCEYESWGKEFVLAVTEQTVAWTVIYVCCDTDTTINIFAPFVSMNKTLQIRSGTEMIRLDNRLVNSRNELEKKGVYVSANKPVSIYVIENFNPRLDAAEGYLALPISALSTEYVVVTDNSANRTTSQFVIAALENNTTVTITFKTSGKINIYGIRYPTGSVFSLEMSTLDTFQVQHGQDLTGTFIQSSKPIAVFSGCKCGFGRPIGGSCQHEVEQIVPICSLGQEYITVPLLPGYRYRVISPFSNTVASIQGQNYTIEMGHFLERWETKPVYIHSSKPVFVMEYGQCTYTNGSDPSMITLLPISTFSNSVTFGLPENLTGSDIRDYLFVVVETKRADELMLDQQRLSPEGVYTVSTQRRTNYTILAINITSGYHTLHHPDTSVQYGAVLYGTGQWTSIGFPLGYHKEIYECSNTNRCHSNAECLSTAGHYKCTCKNGFAGDGTTCADIDECVFLNRCHVSAECHNTAGSYNCTCKNGFTGNGTTCEDIDECSVSDICQVNTECHNTAGSYNCACKNGLVGNGTTCADFDECNDIKRCDVNGDCHNIFGSYYCVCQNGFTGNGTNCADIDECYGIQRCDVHAECHNTIGSYNCTCKDGFTGNGINCADVDECKGGASCDVNAACHNTFGSYICNCSNGFTGSGTTCVVTGNMSTPVVHSEIQLSAKNGNQLVFFCDFRPSTDHLMLYQVTWYRDKLRAEYILTSSSNISYSSRENFRSLTYLPEAKITLGMTIFCTISALQQNITFSSETYFVGFEVISKDLLRLQDLEETLVQIRLTVPFGCQGQLEKCFLDVNMFYTETEADQCLIPTAAALSNCGVRISSWKWNQSYPLRIAIKHGQNLISIFGRYNITFRTDEHFHHAFFRNYTLPKKIQAEVITDTSNLNGKECHAICDPHMQTFDGRYYENQNEGTYILYKHQTSPVQVQMRTNPCYGFREGPPFCPCGVAIASGRDVFVVDRCSIPITIYMPQCDDGTLKGKIKSDGNFYQIYLPTGSWVKITSGISFNIYIYPSISDRMATLGLCGSLDNDVHNDFMLRNGTTIPFNKYEDFNANWQVKPEEDLFNNSNYKTLPNWPRENYLCICRQYQEGHIVQSDNCSPDSRKFCIESALNDSLASDCSRKLSTNANVSVRLDPSDFNVSQSENDTDTEIQTRKNYTEDSANYECWSYLNSSSLFEKCAKLPDIDSKSFAVTCAKDALITKTMFWAPTHLDNAQKRCIYQVTVNQPLPEQIIKQFNVTTSSNEQTSNKTTNVSNVYTANLLQELKDLACPMNCSDEGDCIKGQCHCYKGYGGNDCSVDLNKAPDVYGIPNRGVCDLHETSCDRASVLGDNFVDSKNLSCRLSLFQVKVNETIFDDNVIVLKGQWISFAEISCPVVDVRSKRSVQFPDDLDTLAIGYKVAVGNTRDIFGRDISLLIVDSLCVDCIKAGFNITCTLKDGFDLINRRCSKKISPVKKVESGSTVLIISSVVGSVLVIIVVGVLLHYCLVVRTRRAKYEKENRERSYIELQEMEKRKDYYGTIEEVYDEIKDSNDDYSVIRDIIPTDDESKDSGGSYIKLSNVQKNESEGYSCLSKLATNECEAIDRKHDTNEQGAPAGLRYQKRPLPAKIHEDVQL